MEDRNSPEAMAARAGQEDPIIMYLIVRESLGMSPGKTAAQCAHASQMLTLKFLHLKIRTTGLIWGAWDRIRKIVSDFFAKPEISEDESIPNQQLFEAWLDTSFRKVVLRANDHQFNRMKTEVPNHIVVVDAGLTEIEPGSETVLGLWPMYKSQAPRYLQKLQVFK
jgi:PTH2 family peptidyl-tRNA hydrolase